MCKTLSDSSSLCKSENLDSIQKLQNSELQRQQALVAKQEFQRKMSAEEQILCREYGSAFVESQQDLGFSAPRTCNTGALIAPGKKIDWLEFTVLGVSPEFACSEYLKINFDAFSVNDFGLHGYPDSAQYGKTWVLWSERKPERGTKIILSSKALDEVGQDAIDIIRCVLRDGGTFARIDGAIDDRSGAVTIDTVITAVDGFHDVSRFTQVEVRQPIDARTRKPVGRSVYWGKPASSRQIVAYDKELEQYRKTGEKTGPWLRFEARWKKRAANLAAKKLCDRGLEGLAGMVRGILDFRLQDNAETDRRTVCSWWSNLLDTSEIIRTGVRKVVKTIEEKAEWLGKSVAKTMGQVAALMGVDTIVEIVRAGAYATDPRTWKQLDPTGQRILLNDMGKIKLAIPF